MQLLGIPDGIEKPIVKANGISISAVVVEMQVGEIASCSFQIPPEFSDSFSTYGKIVIITISSKSANGVLFTGRILSCGFSNMVGSINCRVDLVHDVASRLDSASTLFPGNMPGSAFDDEAYIKADQSGLSKSLQVDPTILSFNLTTDFVDDTITTVTNYINKAALISSTGMAQPHGGQEIENALQGIISYCGQISSSGGVTYWIATQLSQILKAGDISSTFWNVLSQFFGIFDIVLVCCSDGSIRAFPNLSGIAADETHSLPSKWIASFDQSSKYDRTPSEVYVLVSNMAPPTGSGMNLRPYKVGHSLVSGAPSSASGQFSIEAPPFLRSLITSTSDITTHTELMDKYAKLTGIRETAKLMTCNVVCPLILGVFPGVPVSFEHLTSVRSFSGTNITAFNKKFDGYCYKISHEISSEGYPKTVFHLSGVTDGAFQKEKVHPLWTGANIPAW